MIDRHLVVPFDEGLILRLGSGQRIVPTLTTVDDVQKAVDSAHRAGSSIQCIEVDTNLPIALVDLKEEHQNIPLALRVTGLGKFPEFMARLGIIRRLDVRVYLPASSPGCLTAARILSSLGVETALLLEGGHLDWKAIGDLASYALFAKAPHASMAPFSTLAERYRVGERIDFSAVYFDDPRSYLHVDTQGRVACTRADLFEGRFMAESIEGLGDVEQNIAYREHLNRWRDFFLRADGCAYCPGWRICLGRFDETREADPGCREFFSFMLDSVEEYGQTKEKERTPWQP